MCSPYYYTSLLMEVHGAEEALLRSASKCTSPSAPQLVTHLLVHATADCMNGKVFVEASSAGHADIIRMLLAWPEHAPHADCHGGCALVLAAHRGQ